MLVGFGAGKAWVAFGLGLMLPGGGFMLGSYWWLAAANLFLFFGAVVVAKMTGNALPVLSLWLGGAIWASEHAATAGTCELLQLFGYAYAFQFWPAARWVVPCVAAVALLLTHFYLANNSSNKSQ